MYFCSFVKEFIQLYQMKVKLMNGDPGYPIEADQNEFCGIKDQVQ
jgi:hypothetical protein